jgi:DNA-binding transcriptional ArsR family regulator
MTFDPKAELEKLQQQTKLIRKTRKSNSRLDEFKGELVQLNAEGASVSEIQRWLRSKRTKVAWSTVSRWLKNHG